MLNGKAKLLLAVLFVAGAALLAHTWISSDSISGVATHEAKIAPSPQRTESSKVVIERMSKANSVAPPAKKEVAAGNVGGLPPLGLPLRETITALRAAANESAQASCRLAHEMDRCSNLETQQRNLVVIDSALAKMAPNNPNFELRSRQVKELREQVGASTTFCEGLTKEQVADSWQFALAAANAGYLPSMVRFVRRFSSGLNENDPLESPEGWIAYKQSAPSLLQTAVSRGSPDAIEYAAFMYLREQSGWRILPSDPIEGLAHYIALKSVATADYLPHLDAAIRFHVERLKLSAEDVVEATNRSRKIEGYMVKAGTRNVDFSKGNRLATDGSHCSATR